MFTRSSHVPPQTIKQAKAQYRKCGPRISTQESKQLERGAELLRRADKLKEAERRKKVSQKKKQQKEIRERELKRANGPDQCRPKVRASQGLLDNFVKCGQEQSCNDDFASSTEEESWSDDDIDEFALINVSTDNTRGAPETEACDVSRPSSHVVSQLEEDWGDLVESDTQIHRDISTNQDPGADPGASFQFDMISTQDLTLSASDISDLGLQDDHTFDLEAARMPCSPRVVNHQGWTTSYVKEDHWTESINRPAPSATSSSFTDGEISTQIFQEITSRY